MAEVKSTQYPGLWVVDVDVRFVDGVAEVTDPTTLEHLRGLAHMGVEVPDDAPNVGTATDASGKRGPGRPRKTD